MADTRFFEKISSSRLNQYLLAMRYRDCSIDFKEASSLSLLSKAMLLGYGSTHSAHTPRRGLFSDIYHREAIDPQETDLHGLMLKSVRAALSKIKTFTPTELTHFVPIHNLERLKELLGESFSEYFTDEHYEVNIAGKKIPVVRIKEEHIIYKLEPLTTAEQRLGNLGQYPNRDTQLWIAANGDSTHFEAEFTHLYQGLSKNGDTQLEKDLKTLGSFYTPSTECVDSLKSTLLKNLREHKSHPAFDYHLGFIHILIDSIEIPEKFDKSRHTQLQLAFSRLQFLLTHAFVIKNNDDRFTLFLEFAFDELFFINALTQNKSQAEIEDIFKTFITDQYGQKPLVTAAGISNSGIAAITQNIIAAFQEAQSKKETIKIYFQRESYFEINLHLKTYINYKNKETLPEEVVITLDEHPHLSEYKNEVCDVLVCDLISSVSILKPGHFEFKVEELIEQQLKLRKDRKEDNSQIIAIIDTTANKLDDDHMIFLLDRFKHDISAGRLAIITAHSLNKYFHMGFDKLPAGLTTSFYLPKAFPTLAKFHRDHVFINYEASDPTPQMIATIAKAASAEPKKGIRHDAMDYIKAHHRAIKQKSYELHKKAIPRNLITREDNPLIFIHNPAAGLFQNWGFIVFELKKQPIRDNDASNLIEVVNSFHEIIDYLEIENRGGYGYMNTTQSHIPGNFIRLSIGSTENTQRIRLKIQILANYIMDINEAFRHYANHNIQQFLSVVKDIEKTYMHQFDEFKKLYESTTLTLTLDELDETEDLRQEFSKQFISKKFQREFEFPPLGIRLEKNTKKIDLDSPISSTKVEQTISDEPSVFTFEEESVPALKLDSTSPATASASIESKVDDFSLLFPELTQLLEQQKRADEMFRELLVTAQPSNKEDPIIIDLPQETEISASIHQKTETLIESSEHKEVVRSEEACGLTIDTEELDDSPNVIEMPLHNYSVQIDDDQRIEMSGAQDEIDIQRPVVNILRPLTKSFFSDSPGNLSRNKITDNVTLNIKKL